MTRLLWDQVGSRLYEAGVDRGVLYLADGSGVPWNGLTSIEEDMGDDSAEPVYFDGVKVTDRPLIGDYSATLKAFTYPDEFLEYEGVSNLGNGLYVDDQPTQLFGLSYRTLVGNDVDGTDHGYKIHLVYNLTAATEPSSYETVASSANPLEFSWKISGIPQDAVGYRPTAHVIFDSRFLNSAMFAAIEDFIYGDPDTNARLPSINELITFVSQWDPKVIVPDTVGGLAQLIPGTTAGTGDLTQINVDGVYTLLPSTKLVASDVDGFYVLTP